jgi:hypothetical protein
MIIGQIKDGLVLDHITAGKAMTIYNILKLDELDCTVAMIKNADSPVTSSATDYSSHFVIIHSVLQILQTLTVRAGEPAELTFRMMRYAHLQSPRVQHVRRPVYQSRLNSP